MKILSFSSGYAICFRYKGGPALPRKMICEGIFCEKRVEVYPLSLKLIDSRDNSQSIIRLSKKVMTYFFVLLFISLPIFTSFPPFLNFSPLTPFILCCLQIAKFMVEIAVVHQNLHKLFS